MKIFKFYFQIKLFFLSIFIFIILLISQISQSLARTSHFKKILINRSHFTANEIPSNTTTNPPGTIHTSPNPPPPKITPTTPQPSDSSIEGAIKDDPSSLKNNNPPATKSKKVGTPSTIRTWPPHNNSYQN